jgi:ACT domain
LHKRKDFAEGAITDNKFLERDEKMVCLQNGGTNKTSIIFTLKNQVGGLARALQVFQELGINVLHIEFQPTNTKEMVSQIGTPKNEIAWITGIFASAQGDQKICHIKKIFSKIFHLNPMLFNTTAQTKFSGDPSVCIFRCRRLLGT